MRPPLKLSGSATASCICSRSTPRPHCCAPQVIHWLRLGCVPVGVLEGRPPPEKLEALRARFRAHTGVAGGGGGGGAAAFQRLGGRVGAMLRAMVRACRRLRVRARTFAARSLDPRARPPSPCCTRCSAVLMPGRTETSCRNTAITSGCRQNRCAIAGHEICIPCF